MAGKKPAKPMAGQNRAAVVLDPAIYGSLVKLYGSKNSKSECGTCAKEIVSGMIREKNNIFYCSIVCVKTSN